MLVAHFREDYRRNRAPLEQYVKWAMKGGLPPPPIGLDDTANLDGVVLAQKERSIVKDFVLNTTLNMHDLNAILGGFERELETKRRSRAREEEKMKKSGILSLTRKDRKMKKSGVRYARRFLKFVPTLNRYEPSTIARIELRMAVEERMTI
jgi:hypothetical protein